MEAIQRSIWTRILDDLREDHKAIIIYGPRQSGKTTLVKSFLLSKEFKTLFVNADLAENLEVLSSRNLEKLKSLIGDHNLLIIDEAQNIENIGKNIKILYDEMPELKIILTGSCTLDMANELQEPLTGRVYNYHLYPLSIKEIAGQENPIQIHNNLEQFLLYGSYPEVLQKKTVEKKIRVLREIAGSYLYKDILKISKIRKSEKLVKLVKLLAYQCGSLVSMHELAQQLAMSSETVEEYIAILEKAFIIYRLPAFSMNARNEINKKQKIYFIDNGIRNMLIENFNPLEFRYDLGHMWENWLISERLKKISYDRIYCNRYYWRNYSQVEVDYIEERNGILNAYELKWTNKNKRAPKSFLESHNNSVFKVITKENYMEFIM
ncbi:MAG: ATP-binding protein [Saprospiraceae bacterium]|nr:ATP-binding protein [Saprospiraceae bacterium]